ncbi:aspartate aminotransferase family protein [Pelobacter propionicus]|uniref:Acetylornithine aminotransferase apoenzyme n=1 Tax=Pelobacter propionicus (strain DSM 2379 / NBRC 103807 / OttBd1) TaxID=338966 RepID=A1ALH7_PELPD|nr:aspartate aminotransferase family protein [Pelobacter propionicus]ABK98197.1 acetylornithine aminotransferase apoenzyme [Pelobacter propionicus DSM 2379]
MTTNAEIVARQERVFTPALHIYHPVAIENGEGSWVTDREGKRYLDLATGIAVLNIGHNHPRVRQRVAHQLERFVHTGGIYYNDTSVEAAELLASVTPPGLDMVFFSNAGAEAVEGALKLARFVTGRQGIIAFSGAFHGRTLGAVSVTTSSARYRSRYQPLLPSVYHAPYPYCYRCPLGRRPESCSLDCFRALEEMLERLITPAEVAAILIEPVLGEGGYAPAPPEFLRRLRRLCDEHGILLIFDEVQSGMGRTGDWFAAQRYDVTPDVMTVAKGIASGFPLSAVVAKRRIMEQWPCGAHGTTFGGNPVACAAAIATMETIRDEGLLPRCRELGERAMVRLRGMGERHPLIGDVRGMGLMIGVELLEPDARPAGDACERLMAWCRERGLLIINCGPDRNVLRLVPPLTIGDDELEQALSIIDEGLGAVA